MASQLPEHGHEHASTYDQGNSAVVALLGAVLINAGIIGLFMFITWFAYWSN